MLTGQKKMRICILYSGVSCRVRTSFAETPMSREEDLAQVEDLRITIDRGDKKAPWNRTAVPTSPIKRPGVQPRIPQH